VGTGSVRNSDLQLQATTWASMPGEARLHQWRFDGVCASGPSSQAQTLLCGWNDDDGPVALWVGLQPGTNALGVSIVPQPGEGAQTWDGPILPAGQSFAFELAIHTGMGPGGFLYRSHAGAPWTSLQSSSARGAEHMAVPVRWAPGHAQSCPADRPFLGSDLRTWYASRTLEALEV